MRRPSGSSLLTRVISSVPGSLISNLQTPGPGPANERPAGERETGDRCESFSFLARTHDLIIADEPSN